MDYRTKLINLVLQDYVDNGNHLESLLFLVLEGFVGLRKLRIENLEGLVRDAYDHLIMEGETVEDFVENIIPTIPNRFRDDVLFMEKEFHQ